MLHSYQPFHAYLTVYTFDPVHEVLEKRVMCGFRSENYSSHIEGYLFFMQEQEVNTNAAKKRREKDPAKRRNINGKCRLSAQRDEDLFHIICFCLKLSDMLYLHQRHDQIARVIYQEIVNTEKGNFTEYIENLQQLPK